MKKIKAGVIGTGFIGPVHVEALMRLGNVDVTAIAGRSEEKTKAKADTLGIGKAYGDWKQLVHDPDVEVVHVCSPNSLHFDMVKEVIRTGKHIMCEKPLTTTIKEAEILVEMAEKAGVAHAINFNIRYYPLARELRSLIMDGEVGDIRVVHGSYLQDWLFLETDYNWRMEQEQSGESRAVADIGSHWLDLVEYVTGGKVIEVCGDFRTFYKTRKKPLKAIETYSNEKLKPGDYEDVPIDTEDYAAVLLRFDNGAVGTMMVNQVAAGRKNRLSFEVQGAKKSTFFDSENPNYLWLGARDRRNEILMKDPDLFHRDVLPFVDYPKAHNEGFPDTFKMMMRDFYGYIEGGCNGDPGFPTFAAGLREQRLCQAIIDSNKTGNWTRVSE